MVDSTRSEILLFGIRRRPPRQFFFVFGSGVGGIFCLGIFASQRSRATVRLEVLCCGFISPYFHETKLVPLPDCDMYECLIDVCDSGEAILLSRFVDRTKEMCTPRLRWLAEQSRQR